MAGIPIVVFKEKQTVADSVRPQELGNSVRIFNFLSQLLLRALYHQRYGC